MLLRVFLLTIFYASVLKSKFTKNMNSNVSKEGLDLILDLWFVISGDYRSAVNAFRQVLVITNNRN